MLAAHPLACRAHPQVCQGLGSEVAGHTSLCSRPQVLAQRSAVLRVLQELGLGQQDLEEKVVECWNKVDLLPGGGLLPPEGAHAGQLHGRERSDDEGRSVGRSANAAGCGGGGTGPRSAYEAERRLPAAVEALLGSDPAATRYRPAAVATSAYNGHGLQELLAAVESKVREWRGRQRRPGCCMHAVAQR